MGGDVQSKIIIVGNSYDIELFQSNLKKDPIPDAFAFAFTFISTDEREGLELKTAEIKIIQEEADAIIYFNLIPETIKALIESHRDATRCLAIESIALTQDLIASLYTIKNLHCDRQNISWLYDNSQKIQEKYLTNDRKIRKALTEKGVLVEHAALFDRNSFFNHITEDVSNQVINYYQYKLAVSEMHLTDTAKPIWIRLPDSEKEILQTVYQFKA